MNKFALRVMGQTNQAYRPGHAATKAGAAAYSPSTLMVYDAIVHGLSNRLVWRCPTKDLRQMYQRNISANHIDVGVGAGYFLNNVRFPEPNPRVVLMDLNPHCLGHASRKLERFSPKTVLRDVFEPAPEDLEPFDSMALTNLFHCLPGVIEEKAVVLDNLKPLLRPGARIFGATILSPDEETPWPARRLMALYNRRRVFCNLDDRLEAIETAMEDRFEDVAMSLIGCVAIFEARAPTKHLAVANDV